MTELLQRIRERAAKAHHEINALAQGKKQFIMSIPVQKTDSDVVLQSPLDDIEALIQAVEKQDKALEFYASKDRWSLSGSLGNKREMGLWKSWGDSLSDYEEFKELNSFGPAEHGSHLIMKYPGRLARETSTSIHAILEAAAGKEK
jgi:hypothetical protein